jgi:hypothetical protein
VLLPPKDAGLQRGQEKKSRIVEDRSAKGKAEQRRERGGAKGRAEAKEQGKDENGIE